MDSILQHLKKNSNKFVREATEILILYMVYSIISDTKFDLFKALKICGLVTGFSVLLEYYDPKLKENVKNGMFAGLGNSAIKSAAIVA